MTQFIRFIEFCDHEAETWEFWLQLDGNTDEIEELRELLRSEGVDPEQYQLTGQVEDEFIVDKLVSYAQRGYMPSVQKVTGRFVCPKELGEYGDDLYKGGIMDFFK